MVRNSAELGPILHKIAMALTKNKKLCQYLVNSDDNPLEKEVENTFNLLNKEILLVPEVNKDDFTSASKVCIVLDDGDVGNNTDYKELYVNIVIYTPLKKWIINELGLRPFSIMGEIEQSLKDKRIESLGKIKYLGFSLATVDDDLSGYVMRFSLDVFN